MDGKTVQRSTTQFFKNGLREFHPVPTVYDQLIPNDRLCKHVSQFFLLVKTVSQGREL